MRILEALADHPLYKKRQALYMKIRAWKRKGKDTTELERQYAELTAQMTGERPSANPISSSEGGADFQKGYEEAIKAIKQAQQNKSQQNQQGQGGGSGDDLGIPMDPSDQQSSEAESGNGSGNSQRSQGQSKQSRNGKQEGQGVVRPEDCASNSTQVADTPGTPGGVIDKATGDKLAEAEGYPKEGGTDGTIEKDWTERGKKAASKIAGKGAGYEKLKGKLDGLYKVAHDWKKELRKIVGNAISPEDKRQAYANKNVLISQNRIARTDKDKFDNVDYMMAWIDTSGSMSQEYLMKCLNEVYAVALAKKPMRFVIVQFDTRITDVQEFTSIGDMKKRFKSYSLKGGGGTDVKPCFDMLVKDKKYSRRPAELVMIFTDGYLEQYKRNPRTMRNLCWVVVDNPGWDLKYKDSNTKAVRIKMSDLGK